MSTKNRDPGEAEAFPINYIRQEFAFLTDERGFAIASADAAGRDKDVLFRRGKIGFRVWHEWAVLPQLFIEVYNSEQAPQADTVLHVDWGILRKFGMEKSVYPVHSRIQESFFLVGIYLHMRHLKEINEEVKKRIDEYAGFVKDNFDLLVDYAVQQAAAS